MDVGLGSSDQKLIKFDWFQTKYNIAVDVIDIVGLYVKEVVMRFHKTHPYSV